MQSKSDQKCSFSDSLSMDSQLTALLNMMIEGMIVQEASGRVTHFNLAALRILNITEDQLLGKTPLDPMWKAIREDHSDYTYEERPNPMALKTGLPQVGKIMGVYQPQRGLRWLKLTATPLIHDSKVHQVLTTFQDITDEYTEHKELIQLKTQLEVKEKFLETTLSALPCLVSYIDNQYIYRYVNVAYEKCFKVQRSDWIGKTMIQAIGKTPFDLLKPFLDQAFRGYEQRFEQEIPFEEVGLKTVQVNYLPDMGPDGNVLGIYVVIQDISAQIKAARFIQKKEEELRKIIDKLPAFIGYWNRDFINVHANQAYADFFGKTPQEVKGKHLKDVLGIKLYEENLPYIQAALQGSVQCFESKIYTRENKIRETLVNYIPDDSSEGKVEGLFVIITDISQVKRLEKERQEMEAKMIFSSKMSLLGEMAGSLAHEINNPITIIAGLTSRLQTLAQDKKFDEAVFTNALKKVDSTVRRIARIIHGLLDYAREADDEFSESVDISKLILDTTELCKEKIKNHGIKLKLPQSKSVFVHCRPIQISQILLNLLNNSFDAVEVLDEKWIEVQLRVDRELVCISVIDSGKGIDLKITEKMMNPFFTTKPLGKGTGLGLSISKGLAEMNGGVLEYNEDSPHTCFNLKLPLYQIIERI